MNLMEYIAGIWEALRVVRLGEAGMAMLFLLLPQIPDGIASKAENYQ